MPETKNNSNLLIPASIIIAGFLIAGGLYFGLSKGGGLGQAAGAAAALPVDIKDVQTDGDPYIGNKDAKVVLAYWSDYQCPFCKAVEVGDVEGINFNSRSGDLKEAFPTIIKDYVNTGKLKIVFKDYPFLGNDSITAALYEHAVWKLYQDKFYTWREAMFKAQDDEGDQGFGDEASIVAIIKTISGMDADKIKADVAANKAEYQKKISADLEEGKSFGINGTPGFITGKTLIPGAAELASFKAAIDPQL